MDSHFLTSIETRIENRQTFYGRFQLGPFECGQGLTVANAFRRTLLSECSGLGIIVIQLDGACHEYSTLPGIQESVLEILLNLKQIVLTTSPVFFTDELFLKKKTNEPNYFNINSDDKQLSENKVISNLNLGTISSLFKNKNFDNASSFKTSSIENSDILRDSKNKLDNSHQNKKIKNNNFNKNKIVNFENKQINTTWAKLGFLKIQGPKIVRARDIKLPEPIRCVDPNQYIATLTYDGNLNLKLLICQGKNSIVENLLPIHFNQNWFSQYKWFSQQKIVPNPLTYLLLKDAHKKKQIKPKIIINRQLFFGWQQRKKKSEKKIKNKAPQTFLTKQNSIFDLNNSNLKNSANSFFSRILNSPKVEKNLIFENKKKDNNNQLSVLTQPIHPKSISNSQPILVDSIFMPIQKVNYSVEIDETFNVKKERIILEIWTNGSIHPRQAVSLAAKRLTLLFYPFINI